MGAVPRNPETILMFLVRQDPDRIPWNGILSELHQYIKILENPGNITNYNRSQKLCDLFIQLPDNYLVLVVALL